MLLILWDFIVPIRTQQLPKEKVDNEIVPESGAGQVMQQEE